MRRFLPFFIILTLTLIQVSCGGRSSAPSSPDASSTDSSALTIKPSVDEITIQREGFSLKVLGESFDFGGDASFSLDVAESGGQTEVSVVANTEGLRAVFIELSFAEQDMHPVESSCAAWPGIASDKLVALTMLDVPGAVHHGAIVVHPDAAPGVNGEFTLLTVRFAPGIAEPRVVSAVPDTTASAIPDLVIDWATGNVTFSYYSLGDYNQDSLVGITDITPIGQHWLETSADFPNPFDPATIGSVIDGNADAIININDLTAIGANFYKRVKNWKLYGGNIADYPADASDDNGAAIELGTVEITDTAILSTQARLIMNKTIDTVPTFLGEALWLRPVGSEDEEGIASNMFDLRALDREAPVWTYDPDGIGVLGVIRLDGALRVSWGPATDASNFDYEIWVQDIGGDPPDFSQPPTHTVTPSDPPNPPTDQILEVTGLTNDTEYSVAVRAIDEHGNETDNTGYFSLSPLAEETAAYDFDSDTELDGPRIIRNEENAFISNPITVTFYSDLTIEEGGLLECMWWESLTVIVWGNFVCDGTIDFNVPDMLPGDPEDAPMLTLLLLGDVTFGDTAVVTGNGNINVTDDDEAVTPQDIEDDTDADTNPDDYPFNYQHEDNQVVTKGASAGKSVSRTTYYGPRPWTRWLVRGDWGKVPVQPRGVHRVVLRIHQVNGQLDFQDFSIEGPDARPGNDAHSCTAVGGDGQDNRWRFRIHCGRALTFNNVNIKLGDGGRGGNATTPQDCDPGSATGGDGGDALNKFRFTAGQSINIVGSFNFNPGNGGAGGNATAWGDSKDPGCLAENGAAAIALGGNGGNVPKWGVRMRGNIGGASSVNLGTCEGGVGGTATAWGGDGGDDTCCPGAVGGSGGLATGTGGEGGDAKFTDGGSPAAGGGATGGDGGPGRGAGGFGGAGVSWFKIPGGDGGPGGAGVATGGQAGEATGDGALTQGNRGAAEALGGNGGNGGDGLPPGVGGEGGTATADGDPETELDGSKGLDGEQSPLSLSEHMIILFPTLPIGPVVPGDYIFPLVDRKMMLQIGTILVTLDPGTMGDFTGIHYLDGTDSLLMTGDASIFIDLANAVYDSGAPDPWIGVELTHMNTTYNAGSVGCGYWFDGQILNDELVPEGIPTVPQIDTFMVDTDLFYTFFEPDPLVPPQWDQCQIYTMPTAVTEVIEIVIIDP